MVVLEGHNMLGVNSPNQYLQPDYLSPLPTTLDAKKSPLALLVQTCSQIGADTPNSKSLLHPSPLSSSDSTSSMSSGNSIAGQKRKASTSSDSGHGGSLKSLSDSSSNDSRPRSSGSTSSTGSNAKQPRLSHSTSPAHNHHHQHHHGKVSPKHSSNNNNNESHSVITQSNNNNNTIHHGSKIRKLSGQSISSESSEKNHHSSRHAPSRGSPPGAGGNSASVIVPQGKHSSGGSSVGSRSPPNHSTTSHEKSSSKSSSSSNSNENNAPSKATSSPKPSSHQHDQGASPIIRSGLDVLQGKDLPKFGAFGFPPGFDPTNPAFRLPFLANAAHHAHLLGYPPTGPGGPGGPPAGSPYFFAYNRVKSSTGVESIVPVCKDPYCTGCQYGGGGVPHGAAGGMCPAGCAQCDHQKFPMMPSSATSGPYASIPGFPPGISHAALSAIAAGYPPHLLSHSHNANAAAMAAMFQHHQAQAAAAAQQQQQNAQRPHICSWIVGDSYCGKRFASSEELLQHLRTHTSSSVPTSSASIPGSQAETGSSNSSGMGGHPGLPPQGASSLYSSALLNSSMMAAAMQRQYPTPPLSPHSAARYHPAALYAAIAASGKPPGPMGPIPPPPSALAGYYPSPYSIYGPRIG